ncbi:hypothetical protein L1987_87593 [Smallanthus sonchifolius]|nr:hypothetical protein L1987_87593 [Smallanthus sonchifolius]
MYPRDRSNRPDSGSFRILASAKTQDPCICSFYTLIALTSDVLLEAAVNVISELIHYTSARNLDGFYVQMPLIQVIVPQVMNLKPQLRDMVMISCWCRAVDVFDYYLLTIGLESKHQLAFINLFDNIAINFGTNLLKLGHDESDAYQAIGCYNLLYSGLIQINNEMALWANISPISKYHGSNMI